MASGDGTVDRTAIYCHIPWELRELVEQYRNDMRLISLSSALQRLLETHPAIAEMASTLYTKRNVVQTGKVSPE